MLMKNPERAMANQKAVLEIRQALKDTVGMALTYNRIAEICIQNEDYNKAIANLQQGLKAAMLTDQQDEIRKSYDLLSISFKGLKDFKSALQYRE